MLYVTQNKDKRIVGTRAFSPKCSGELLLRNKNGNKYFSLRRILRCCSAIFLSRLPLSSEAYLCRQFLKLMHSSGGKSGNISLLKYLFRAARNYAGVRLIVLRAEQHSSMCGGRIAQRTQTTIGVRGVTQLLVALKSFQEEHESKCSYGIGSSLSYANFVANLSASNNLKWYNSSPHSVLSSGAFALEFMLHVTHLYLFIAAQPLFHLFLYKFEISLSLSPPLASCCSLWIAWRRKKCYGTRCGRRSLHKRRSTQRLLRLHNYGGLLQVLGGFPGTSLNSSFWETFPVHYSNFFNVCNPQLGTAALLIYSTLAAIYYSKVNPLTSDYDYTDYLSRSFKGRALSDDSTDVEDEGAIEPARTYLSSLSNNQWVKAAAYGFQFAMEAIDKIPK